GDGRRVRAARRGSGRRADQRSRLAPARGARRYGCQAGQHEFAMPPTFTRSRTGGSRRFPLPSAFMTPTPDPPPRPEVAPDRVGDPPTVGRPGRLALPEARAREVAEAGAVGANDVDLGVPYPEQVRIAVPERGEQKPPTVRRPARTLVAPAVRDDAALSR